LDNESIFSKGALAQDANPATGSIKLTIRDSVTGGYISGSFISIDNQWPMQLPPYSAIRGDYQLRIGEHEIVLSAAGYRSLRTHFQIDQKSALDVTIWLDPLEISEELRPEAIRSKDRPAYALFHGHVFDSETGRPLEGVRVGLEHGGNRAQTNNRGYFLLYTPIQEIDAANELPRPDNLIAELDGYKDYRRLNVTPIEGASHFIIDLTPGKGTVQHNANHKLMSKSQSIEEAAEMEAPPAADKDLAVLSLGFPEGTVQAPSLVVPSSIRVGSNCATKSSCTSFNTYSLDTYVKNGLDDEWFPSWTSNSLKAGAIAYRSYGVYYVYHPISTNYDICNTTSCQVNDPSDTATSTNTATTDTSGMVITDSTGNNPFFAEYSAENNDSSCADGFAGSPNDNWGCISDQVDAGQVRNGHGRGMCQWGSQRWSLNQAKDYVWIVNHYYNNNGNPSGARSGVLQTPQGSLPTSVLSPVIGPLRVTSSNLGILDGKWEFNQHMSGLHHPGGGIGGSDDTFAWDTNWYLPTDSNADVGQPVYPTAEGDVVTFAGVGLPNSCNAVLIAHPDKNSPQWWSGYLHLAAYNISIGQHVTLDTALGTVGRSCANNDHLHFVIYRGQNTAGGLISFNANITERNSAASCTNSTTTLRNRDGGPPVHPPGSLLKIASSPTVYLIDSDNRKRAITSSSVLAQLYNQSTDARSSTNFSNWVTTVAQDELDLYEQGGNISAAQPGNNRPFPDGKLIGYNGEVSIVTGGGNRRPFASANTFTGLGFSFCQVVNVTASEYSSYPVGPPVDAMPLLVSSLNLNPASPSIGQFITGTFTLKNVGFESLPLSSLGIGGRLNGSTVFDISFVATTLSPGQSYPFGSQARQLTNAGTYDFFVAYQENNGHWSISVPASPNVVRNRQVNVSSSQCSYSISPTNQSFGSNGGSSSFGVTAGNGCSWTAQSNDGFITITSGGSGSGNGTVNYSVSSNSGSSQRTGTISVNGQVHTVTQSGTGGGGCTYEISTTEMLVGPGQGSASYAMHAPSGCSWTAVSDATSWLTTSSSGSGNGTIRYNYSANSTTTSRIGHITAGGQVLTVTDIGIGGAGSVRFSSATYSANETGGDATITVVRSGGTATGTVNYATSNGTATAGIDYTATSGLLLFGENETSKTFTVPILDDGASEGNESINLTLGTHSDSFTLGSPSTAVLTLIDNEIPPMTVQFDASSSNVIETLDATTRIDIIVTRTGDTSGSASADYASTDGTASDRSDYQAALGTIRFAPGENSKTISIFIVDDRFGEGPETFRVSLSNPVDCTLGSNSVLTVTILSNESVNGNNPVRDATFSSDFFVREHYVDFFNRAPDSGGLAFWKDQIDSCTTQACREIRRINVSGAFFLSIEFQQTGYLVERLYKVAYGDGTGTSTLGGPHQLSVPIVRLNEFLADTQQIGNGVIIGQPGADLLLENNKQALIAQFVQRARFLTAYPLTLTPTQFVDKLNTNTGSVLSSSERTQLINDLTTGAKTRAQVVRAVAEDQDLFNAEKNRAFVLAQFFGYLRRNPNDSPDSDYTGYDFWLGKLNQFNGNFVNADMVKAFIVSGEYQQRFGP
jgi:hypothetical protein